MAPIAAALRPEVPEVWAKIFEATKTPPLRFAVYENAAFFDHLGNLLYSESQKRDALFDPENGLVGDIGSGAAIEVDNG